MKPADATHMRRATVLAARGRGHVSPNPLVGAVIVDTRGTIVGEGYHRQVGGPHAEVHALQSAGESAFGSTAYCTLEPCSHHGRTPPCTQALINAGVARVVCALVDPDENVAGRGIAALRAAGVVVDVGVGAVAVQRLISGYLHHREHGRPRVWLKMGQSIDGCIATRTGASRWITGEPARRHAHRWRARMDMIAVGAGTVSSDDPALTVRHVRGRDPQALVISGRLSCPVAAQVFGRSGTVLATARTATCDAYAARGTRIWPFDAPGGQLDLTQVVRQAGAEGITSMLLEGGRTLAAAALRARIVDEVMIYLAPRIIGDGIGSIGDLGVESLHESLNLEQVATRRLGPDLLYTGNVVYPCSPD